MTDIDALASTLSSKLTADVEAMCEQMLITPGAHGVLVEVWPDRYRISLSSLVEPMTVSYRWNWTALA